MCLGKNAIRSSSRIQILTGRCAGGVQVMHCWSHMGTLVGLAWGLLYPLHLRFRPASGGAFGCKYHLLKLVEEEGGLAVEVLPGSLTYEYSVHLSTLCIQFSVLFFHLPAQPQRGLQLGR